MKKITLLFLMLIASLQINAQLFQVATCNANVGSNLYGPMNSIVAANATSRIASVYPSSQLTAIAGQTLTGSYFKRNSATGVMSGTPNFKIYLKEVTITDFGATALDWATAITGATLVYDSNPTTSVGADAGWKGFTFSTNFLYSGTQNLAVFLEYSNTTALASAITWEYEYSSPCISTTNSNTTKYINNTTGTPGASLSSVNYRRPHIGFDYLVSCPGVTGLAVANVTPSTVDLNWTAGGTELSWEYAILPSTSPAPTSGTVVSTNSVVAAPISANTNYVVYVRAVCGASDNSVWKTVTFNNTVLPGCSTNVSPLDAATNISYSAPINFSWTVPTTGGPVASYDLYYGLTAATVTTLIGNYTTTSALINVTGANTTFYWRIVPKNVAGSATGCTAIYSFTTGAPTGYCFTSAYGQYPTTAYTPANCDGTTANNIVTDAYAGEYSLINVVSGQTYEFKSSIPADVITISDTAGTTALAYGVGTVLWTSNVSGTVRFYTHVNDQCTSAAVNRTRSIKCGAALASVSFQNATLSYYPNPVSDVLNLSYTSEISSVEVYNMLGQNVKSAVLNGTQVKVDMSNLTSGSYIVKVTSDGITKSLKIIKE